MMLDGVIDTHLHTWPDVLERSLDDRGAAERASDHGYAAIVLKNHVESTVGRARLAARDGLRVVGGLCLNQHATGGINPAAVEACFRGGGQVVWMPTFTASSPTASTAIGGRLGRVRGRGVLVTDDAGALLPAVHEVLDLVASANGVLATGHLAQDDVHAVVAGCWRHGVRRVLVQHPESGCTALGISGQRALVEVHPEVLFERCLRSFAPDLRGTDLPTAEQLAPALEGMHALGVAHTVLATDFGLPGVLDPIVAMDRYLTALARAGVSTKDLRRMACTNAGSILEVA